MISTAESRYNQWVREHYRFLLRSAWALTGSRAIAEDVVQDCFTSAWRFRNQLRDPGMARAWLFQIMRRHAFRHFDPAQHMPGDAQAADEAVQHHDQLDAQLQHGWRQGWHALLWLPYEFGSALQRLPESSSPSQSCSIKRYSGIIFIFFAAPSLF